MYDKKIKPLFSALLLFFYSFCHLDLSPRVLGTGLLLIFEFGDGSYDWGTDLASM